MTRNEFLRYSLRYAAGAIVGVSALITGPGVSTAQMPGAEKNIVVKPEINRFGGNTFYIDYNKRTKGINVTDKNEEIKVIVSATCNKSGRANVIYGFQEPGNGIFITRAPQEITQHAKKGYCGHIFNKDLFVKDAENALGAILSARKPAEPTAKRSPPKASSYSAG